MLQDLGDLDAGIACIGSAGQGGMRIGDFVLDESKRVGSGLAQVFVCGDFWKRDSAWESINGESISDSKSAWCVTFVASAMLQ